MIRKKNLLKAIIRVTITNDLNLESPTTTTTTTLWGLKEVERQCFVQVYFDDFKSARNSFQMLHTKTLTSFKTTRVKRALCCSVFDEENKSI